MTTREPLSITHPELAKEADGWDPSAFTYGSAIVKAWKCELGHSWDARISARSTGNGCPFCSGRKTLVGENDLATTNAVLASQALGWNPSEFKEQSNKRVLWRCEFGHEWKAVIADRAAGDGCPICSGRQALAGFNDLATTNPVLASQAAGWDPTLVVAYSHKMLLWRCELGHEWKASATNRSVGTNCPVCSGRQVLSGFNDLKTINPELAEQAFGWDPTTVSPSSPSIKKWKCSLGHEWKTSVNHRAGGTNCPICSGRQVLVGFNDLGTVNPILAAQAVGWDPTTVSQSVGRVKRLWRCDLGHQWSALVADRTAGKGCPTCATRGFDPNAEGWLYFLSHSDWEMFQIGITNVPDDRLSRHESRGWEVLELRGPMDGLLAKTWESAMLRMLKAKGADLANGEIAGKFDGYSEAWSKATFQVGSIKELMHLTEEFEEESTEL